MSGPDSKESHKKEVEDSSANAEEGQGEADPWDVRIVPMLWLTTTYVVVAMIGREWLPNYFATGIGCFVAGLVLFRFRGPRLSRHSFVNWTVFVLLFSTGLSLLWLAVSALWSLLRR